MLGPKMITKRNDLHEKEKTADDDEISKNSISDDDKISATTAPVNSDNENDDSNDAIENSNDIKKVETEEDLESSTIIVEDNGIEKESGTGARKSARKRVQRMVIEADDIGDCDNENDPDYRN